MEHKTLFSTCTLGSIQLKNRIAMAPMTRSRAIGNVPNEMMVKYYADRADAGLIITEGVAPDADGLGYARIPGIYNDAQIAGWKTITDAVHAKGGKIYMQLMHTGRQSHSGNMPEGSRVISASAITTNGQMWTDAQGMQPLPTPQEIGIDEIPALIDRFATAARNAITAGLDGVEIHGANGYLPMQFLNGASNRRTDKYGGNHENRNRFVVELVTAVAAAIGKDKLGIRLSPFGTFNDMVPDANEAAQFLALAKQLSEIGIVYIHLVNFGLPENFVSEFRAAFKGTLILNGGYTADRAEAELAAGNADLISFGRPFISNPDLVRRLQQGTELAKEDPNAFYTADEKGYNDYAVATV